MTKMFLSSCILFLSIMMFFLKHPLSMGLMILIQTLLICMISGMIMKTYWFSYILFLTFLGGLLVLFIYVSSIASNEMFNFTLINKIFIFSCFILSIMLSIYYMNNLYWLNFNTNLYEMNNFFDNMFFHNENNMNLTKLYNTQTYYLMMTMIIYLFITLIAVVKIVNIFYGPLRTSY